MRATLTAVVLPPAFLVQTGVGWAREWRVDRVNGTAATIESVEKRHVLAPGMLVPEGLTMAIVRSGRVRLSSENNVMTLGPGSVAVVRPSGRGGAKTEVLQRVGSIEFDIEKRAAPHFTVQTHFMAAVAKGTAFTISVSKTETSIDVDRGLVQVQDLKSGETAGVGAGHGASVSATEPGLRTAGPDAPEVTQGRPSALDVAPAGQALGSFCDAQAAVASLASGRAAGLEAAASTNDGSLGSAGRDSNSGYGGYGGGDGDRDARRPAAFPPKLSPARRTGRTAPRTPDPGAMTLPGRTRVQNPRAMAPTGPGMAHPKTMAEAAPAPASTATGAATTKTVAPAPAATAAATARGTTETAEETAATTMTITTMMMATTIDVGTSRPA